MGRDKKIENIINSYERKILRRILGPINDNGMCRIRYNKEIYNLYGDLDLSTVKTEKITMGQECAKDGKPKYN
jgi:hypothetical protein